MIDYERWYNVCHALLFFRKASVSCDDVYKGGI